MIRFIYKVLTWPLFRIIFWTRIHNMRNLRRMRGKGMVIVCNHKDNMDSATLFYCLPRRLHALAKAPLFRTRFSNWFFRKLLAYPVEKGKELALMKHSLGVLKRNEALLIYPEGTRVFNPEEALALRNGASMIAIRAGVPILPVVINRAPKAFRLTRVKIGTPIETSEFGGKASKEDLTTFSDKIAGIMREMLDGFEVKPKKENWDVQPLDTARAIVIREREEGAQVLLMKRSRPSYKDGAEYFVTPGGHLEEGETAKQACAREVLEETGIRVNPLRLIYKRIRTTPNAQEGFMDSEMESFWVCEFRGGEISINPDTDEFKEGAATKLWSDGNPRGTYEPMWIPLGQVFDNGFDLKPEALGAQLQIDLQKYGNRLVRKTILLTE